jgi:hypothetical protein
LFIHLLERGLHQLELALVLEQLGGVARLRTGVQAVRGDLVYGFDGLGWAPTPGAPPVGDDPRRGREQKGAFALGLDVAQAPHAHDQHLLYDVVQISR